MTEHLNGFETFQNPTEIIEVKVDPISEYPHDTNEGSEISEIYPPPVQIPYESSSKGEIKQSILYRNVSTPSHNQSHQGQTLLNNGPELPQTNFYNYQNCQLSSPSVQDYQSVHTNQTELPTNSNPEAIQGFPGDHFLLSPTTNNPSTPITNNPSTTNTTPTPTTQTSSTTPTRHPCPQCSRDFATVKILKTHLKTHEGIIYPCPECDKTFLSTSGLREHRKVHAGVRYICHACPREFSSEATMKAHVASHNGVQHACDQCDRTFSCMPYLRQHQKLHSGITYSCPSCSKSFNRKDRYRMHLKLHQGVRHTCKECSKEFSNEYNLKNHMVLHDVRAYVCELCARQFTRVDHFNHHRRLQHDPEEFEKVGATL
ncbi:hypothetical protein M8J76_007083 [Diaphorina citri]|nr:hypothetical protein M8J76_007083 [Diaphorina citri]